MAVVTSHGTPLETTLAADRGKAGREALLARLRAQPAIDIGPWRREDLYQTP